MWPTPWFTIGTKPTPDMISGKGSESSALENAGPTDWKKNVWSLFSFCHRLIFAFSSTLYYLTLLFRY